MDATSGRDGLAPRATVSARQITSDATVDPPGLSTLSTTALIDSSSRMRSICSTIVSDPTIAPFTVS